MDERRLRNNGKNRITLRRIKRDDIEWARLLRNKNRKFFFDTGLISKEQQDKWYKALNYPFFVIELNGERVGTIAVKKSFNQAELHNVLLDEKYRGRGVLKAVLPIIEEKFGKPLYVDVYKNAISIYKKLGFSQFAYKMRKK